MPALTYRRGSRESSWTGFAQEGELDIQDQGVQRVPDSHRRGGFEGTGNALYVECRDHTTVYITQTPQIFIKWDHFTVCKPCLIRLKHLKYLWRGYENREELGCPCSPNA